MRNLKLVKIYIVFAVLLFVAKPFVGYSIFNHSHLPVAVKANILVKSFTKRKLEYPQNNDLSVNTAKKKLADPIQDFLLRFAFLLGIISCYVFSKKAIATTSFLRRLQLSIHPSLDAYILNGKLII